MEVIAGTVGARGADRNELPGHVAEVVYFGERAQLLGWSPAEEGAAG